MAINLVSAEGHYKEYKIRLTNEFPNDTVNLSELSSEEQKINLFVFDEPRQFEWLHEGNGKLISDEKMFEKNELITIYPNSEMEVVKAIKVPKGVYQLLFTLKTRNGKKIKLADFVEQKNYQSISKRKMKND